MRALMRMVVAAPDGTGRQADVKGYRSRRQDRFRRQGLATRRLFQESEPAPSFVAAFPIDAPRYVVLVVMDEPHGTKETYNFATAGWNAAPTVGKHHRPKSVRCSGVFPMGHDDNFQPLVALMQPYASGGTRRLRGRTGVASDSEGQPPDRSTTFAETIIHRRATDDAAPGATDDAIPSAT